jgi:DNA invertase Pin-like site-specific DNA recombinase
MCRNYVVYKRVSTAKQGASGLGLEAQESAVQSFLAARGSDAKAVGSFTEVESGKRSDRPELAKAMERARLTGATLLIAKLDRLSRNAAFLIGLRDAGVPFVACDMPDANSLTIGIMALMAQHEREAISKRTSDALKIARARVAKKGQEAHPEIKRLGNPNGAAHLRQFGHKRGVDAIKLKAQARADGLADTIAALKVEGFVSANAIAGRLNERNFVTPRGGKWTARSVLNVIARAN